MKKHRREKGMGGRLAVLLLALALLLTACSQEEVAEELEEDTPWYADEQPKEAEDPLPERFALAYQAGQSLDPVTCSEGIQRQLGNLLYEPLFALDQTFTPQAVLCDQYTVSEDGLSYRFHIRSGVYFSDGSLLTAADVAATLRRAMTSERYGNRLSDIRQVTADDEYVQVNLRQANNALPALLEIPIVKSGTEDSAVPAGTGPYLLITTGDDAYLQANDSWWQGKSLPLQRIDLVNAKDQDTAQHLFTSHEVQFYSADLTSGGSALTGSLDCVDAATTIMQFIGIKADHPLLADGAVRRALSLGIDRDTVCTGYLSSHALPASAPLSPRSALYPGEDTGAYSRERYRQALEDAGLDTGTTTQLRLLVNEESGEKGAVALAIAQMLTAADLEVVVETLPWTEYLEALAAGNFDLYYGEVKLGADWDVTALIGTGGSLNYGGWSNASTDLLLSEFRSSADREQAAQALYTHLATQCPILPVCFTSTSVLSHRGTIEGITPTADNIFYDFSQWSISLQDA